MGPVHRRIGVLLQMAKMAGFLGEDLQAESFCSEGGHLAVVNAHGVGRFLSVAALLPSTKLIWTIWALRHLVVKGQIYSLHGEVQGSLPFYIFWRLSFNS